MVKYNYSKHRNIYKYGRNENKYFMVKVFHNKVCHGNNMKFKDEYDAITFRNKIWKKYKPDLYKKEFEEGYNSEDEELSSLDNSEEGDNVLEQNTSCEEIDFIIPNPVPECIKRDIIRAQDIMCPICKKELKILDDYQLDHIYPTSKGGIHRTMNFQVLHTSCHMSKTNIIIDKNSYVKKNIFDNDSLSMKDKIDRIKLVQYNWRN